MCFCYQFHKINLTFLYKMSLLFILLNKLISICFLHSGISLFYSWFCFCIYQSIPDCLIFQFWKVFFLPFCMLPFYTSVSLPLLFIFRVSFARCFASDTETVKPYTLKQCYCVMFAYYMHFLFFKVVTLPPWNNCFMLLNLLFSF